MDEKEKELLEKFRDRHIPFKHLYHISWAFISHYVELSEDEIEEYKDFLNWEYVSFYQCMSEDFICRHCELIDWDALSRNPRVPKMFKIEMGLL